MKKLTVIAALLLLLTACNHKKATESNTAQTSIDLSKTTVIYFHTNHRCATCLAVENTAKETLQKHYGEQVPFYSIDINLDQNKALTKQLHVAGQSLLVVKDEQQTNLINSAVMYARSTPEKVEKEIVSTIESYK